MHTQDIVENWRREARREGKSEVLLRLLRQRFGDAVDTEIERRILAGSAEQVDTWADRVLTATTLTELLAD